MCDGRVVVVKGFEELEKEGATPCPKCGDVFPTHPPEQCPNHPYLMAGDEGFKVAYDAQAAEVLDQLKAVASKTTGREDENTVCPACTVSETNHNWRSCLKSLKCRRNKHGVWQTEPPGDPQEIPKGYQGSPCKNCCTMVLDHFTGNCPRLELPNFGV